MESNPSSPSDKMDQDSETATRYAAHMEEKRNTCLEKVRKILEQEIPAQISQLDHLIGSGHFDVVDCETAVSEGLPVPSADYVKPVNCTAKPACVLFPGGEVKSHAGLEEFTSRIRRHLMSQVKLFLEVSNQLALVVPKMESGNSFGLLILGSFFMSLVKFINESQVDLENCMKFNRNRTNMVVTISNYPHCEDARQALANYDEEYMSRFQMYAEQMRMRYLLVHDHYIKNQEKIHRPVPENPLDLY